VIDAQLDAHELDAERGYPRVFSQSWARRIPRDLVSPGRPAVGGGGAIPVRAVVLESDQHGPRAVGVGGDDARGDAAAGVVRGAGGGGPRVFSQSWARRIPRVLV